jgi:predicted  nucleic acid-binding Zn-ribbon protein
LTITLFQYKICFPIKKTSILKEGIRMIKKSGLFVLVIAILFMLSWGVSGAAQQDEKNLKQKIAQLKEKVQELAVKIERNPDAEKAGEWREMRRKYINEMEKLLALLSPRESERETGIRQVKEQIQELRNALERDPGSEKAEQWRGYLREYEQRLRRLERGGETGRPQRQERRLTDWEIAINRTQGQLHEIETYLEQLRKKKESEEKIHEVELRLVKTRNQLAEFRAQFEKSKRGAAKERPSAYQRERGELTAYVISATSEDVTVRLKDSGKVMVLRVSQWRRVERRRVPNTDMIKMVKKLKKNQLIWARYNEGEERGTYFIQEIKKIKDDK